MRISLAILGCLLMCTSLHAQLTMIVKDFPGNTPEADTLFLSGDLNNWTAAAPDFQFLLDSQGQHFLTLSDTVRTAFEYKLTRGSWERVETDQYGHFRPNRKWSGIEDTIRLSVLSWDDLRVDPPHGWLTVQVSQMPENTPIGSSIFAVGNFNAWHTDDPTYQLLPDENGVFTVRLPLMSDTLLYKFGRGNWATIEGRRNGRARTNREFVVGRDDPNAQEVQIESWEDLAGRPINPYTFLLLLAAFQGLLLVLAINTLQNNNRAANRVLSLLLLLLSVALIGRVSTYDREIFNWLPRLLLVPDLIYFLYAPIFLIYINRLLRHPSQKDSVVRWWIFIPFVLQVVLYLPLIWMDKVEFIAKVVDQQLKPFFAVAGGLALIYNAVYWLLCRRTIQQYEREYGDSHAFEPNLKFLQVVMWLYFSCLVLWGLTYLLGSLGILLEMNFIAFTDKMTDALWVVFSLIVFFLGYYTMRQPEIFKLPAIEDHPEPDILVETEEKANTLEETELISFKEKLETTIREEQPYRNPGLSLAQLAEMTGISHHALSRVINEGYEMNFNDFINSYRIEEFKRLARDEGHQQFTLLALAFQVGFNSKSAFNRSFKKLEHCTPREYLKQTVEER